MGGGSGGPVASLAVAERPDGAIGVGELAHADDLVVDADEVGPEEGRSKTRAIRRRQGEGHVLAGCGPKGQRVGGGVDGGGQAPSAPCRQIAVDTLRDPLGIRGADAGGGRVEGELHAPGFEMIRVPLQVGSPRRKHRLVDVQPGSLVGPVFAPPGVGVEVDHPDAMPGRHGRQVVELPLARGTENHGRHVAEAVLVVGEPPPGPLGRPRLSGHGPRQVLAAPEFQKR